jgi:hypothetical protein
MRIIFPLVQTIIALGMALNFYASKPISYDFTLWVFGVVSGIAIASWINYFRE